MSKGTGQFEERIRAIYKAGCDGILPSESPLQLILGILSAVRDGQLDEALGVAGRAAWLKQGDEDHIYNKDNLHTLCPKCNRSKGARDGPKKDARPQLLD